VILTTEGSTLTQGIAIEDEMGSEFDLFKELNAFPGYFHCALIGVNYCLAMAKTDCVKGFSIV